MPLWNEILVARIPPPPCLIHLHLEHPPPETGAGAGGAPARLATFQLAVPQDLPGAFSDANLSAAGPEPPAASATGAAGPAGGPRLRVAFSLDRRHVEAIQRGLWPSDARYLRKAPRRAATSGGDGDGSAGGT